MKVKEAMQKEKLENILNYKSGNNMFKITVVFRQDSSKEFQKAYAIAKTNKNFYEEGVGSYKKVYASFYPEDSKELHSLFSLVSDKSSTKILLNNKQLPYVHDLWMFLMWFYKVS